jgi:hypothetical protein
MQNDTPHREPKLAVSGVRIVQCYVYECWKYPSSVAVTIVVVTFNIQFLTSLETVIKFQIATKCLICSGFEFCDWKFENNT